MDVITYPCLRFNAGASLFHLLAPDHHTGCGDRLTSNISPTLVRNKNVDHSDVVGASPVSAAPTTSSLSTFLTHGFNELGKGNCKTIQETFKSWNLVRLMLEILRYLTKVMEYQHSSPNMATWVIHQRITCFGAVYVWKLFSAVIYMPWFLYDGMQLIRCYHAGCDILYILNCSLYSSSLISTLCYLGLTCRYGIEINSLASNVAFRFSISAVESIPYIHSYR